MESENNRPININSYNSAEEKLCASIKWLITRIYEHNDMPDNLRVLFYRDDSGHLQLRDIVAKCLTSGTFYTQAASKILRNNVLVTQGVPAVLRALSSVGVDVREADGSLVTEAALAHENPLKVQSHLALIDSLMAAHLKCVISIERVVQAISAYTSVEKREEPLDCVDALLFWINKICLLVRDDVERNELVLESNNDATVPEMEDLYEDLCDGTCVCVLVSFYRPHDLPLQKIYFNDPMHINDCRFNLGLLKEFCETALPFNPFHFEIEDILYLHESLQPNVNVFLADLFDCFEGRSSIMGHQYAQVPNQPLVSPTSAHRRFVPIAGIPDLRSQQTPPTAAPAVNRLNRLTTPHASSQRDRAISMASVDSLMTTRSGDSLMFSTAKPQPNFGPNTTRFGDLLDHMTSNQDSEIANGANAGASAAKALAVEAKLQMVELRRQYEANKLLQNVANEEKRSQAIKDAFFRVMSKSTHDDGPSQVTESARDTYTSRENLSAQLHNLQEQINNIKLNPKLSEHGRQTPAVDSTTGMLPYGSSPSSTVFMSSTNTLTRQPLNYSQEQSSYAHLLTSVGSAQFGRATPTVIGYGAGGQPYGISPAMYMDQPSQQQHQQQRQPFFGSNFNLSIRPAPSQQNISPYGAGGSSQMPLPSGYMTLPHNAPHTQAQQPYYGQQVQQSYFGASGGYQMPFQPQGQSPYYPGQPQLIATAGGQFGPLGHPQQPYMPQQPMLVSPPHHQQPHQQMFGGPPMMAAGELSSPLHEYAGGWHADGMPLPGSIMSPPPAVSLHQQQSSYEENNGGTFRLHQPNASTSRLDPPLELNRNLTNWGLTYRMGERAPRKSWSKNTFRNAETDVTANGQNGSQEDGANANANVNSQTPTSGGGLFCSTSIHSALVDSRNGNEDGTQAGTLMSRNSVTVFPSSVDRRSATASVECRLVSTYIPTDDSSATNADNPELTAEMQAKRRALLLNQMRRKERIVAQIEEKEQEMSERRHLEQQKLEQTEQRKLERELKRQRLLEDYKRRKMEHDLGDPSLAGGGGGSVSARMSASSTTSLNRGHSQPPIGRPKSQSNMSLSISRTMQRSARTHSNVSGSDENSTPRVSVPSTAEPTLKLYAKHQPKSNRTLMMNALQYRVFPGAVTADLKSRVQCALAQSDSKHFLVLFRDHKCQYRGMYTWDQISDTVYKIDGTGPKICREDAMVLMFKYDSGAKLFNQIPTKHLSATIDGFTIDEQFWQKTRIPHS